MFAFPSGLRAVARGLLGAAALAFAGTCSAQARPAAPPAPPRLADLPALPAPAASAASAPATAASAAKPHVHVIEDDNVRIEESKVRGQTQRITVRDKTGAGRDYEILLPTGGRDASQERGTSGQRAWSLFAF